MGVVCGAAAVVVGRLVLDRRDECGALYFWNTLFSFLKAAKKKKKKECFSVPPLFLEKNSRRSSAGCSGCGGGGGVAAHEVLFSVTISWALGRFFVGVCKKASKGYQRSYVKPLIPTRKEVATTPQHSLTPPSQRRRRHHWTAPPAPRAPPRAPSPPRATPRRPPAPRARPPRTRDPPGA